MHSLWALVLDRAALSVWVITMMVSVAQSPTDTQLMGSWHASVTLTGSHHSELLPQVEILSSYHQWWITSLWPSDAIWQHRSRSTLAQVMVCYMTKPLPESMLTSHQQCYVAFISEQFHSECSNCCSILWVWKLVYIIAGMTKNIISSL